MPRPAPKDKPTRISVNIPPSSWSWVEFIAERQTISKTDALRNIIHISQKLGELGVHDILTAEINGEKQNVILPIDISPRME